MNDPTGARTLVAFIGFLAGIFWAFSVLWCLVILYTFYLDHGYIPLW